jgi:hypothetical protein
MKLLSKTFADKDMGIKALERVRNARISDVLGWTKQIEQLCLEIEVFVFDLERLLLFFEITFVFLLCWLIFVRNNIPMFTLAYDCRNNEKQWQRVKNHIVKRNNAAETPAINSEEQLQVGI